MDANDKSEIKELIELLQQDRLESNARYPQQAEYALQDERVVKAIEARFKNNQILSGIFSLGENPATGFIDIGFEFSKTGKIALESDSVLVILNNKNQVVSIVDPFSPIQLNADFSSAVKTGELPFVVARPSGATAAILGQPELSSKFVNRGGMFQSLQGIPEPSQMVTPQQAELTAASTYTYCCCRNTLVSYTCRQVTGWVAPTCDAWGPVYQPDQYPCDSLD